MAKFIYIFHGGTVPTDTAEREAMMGKWMAWFGEMGDAVVDGGAPLGMSSTVSGSGVASNGGSNPAMGYCVVLAENIDAANEMAKGCPNLDREGSVEVAELMSM